VELFEQFKFYLTGKERNNLEKIRWRIFQMLFATLKRDQNMSQSHGIPQYTTGLDLIITEDEKKLMYDFMIGLRSATEAQLAAIQI